MKKLLGILIMIIFIVSCGGNNPNSPNDNWNGGINNGGNNGGSVGNGGGTLPKSPDIFIPEYYWANIGYKGKLSLIEISILEKIKQDEFSDFGSLKVDIKINGESHNNYITYAQYNYSMYNIYLNSNPNDNDNDNDCIISFNLNDLEVLNLGQIRGRDITYFDGYVHKGTYQGELPPASMDNEYEYKILLFADHSKPFKDFKLHIKKDYSVDYYCFYNTNSDSFYTEMRNLTDIRAPNDYDVKSVVYTNKVLCFDLSPYPYNYTVSTIYDFNDSKVYKKYRSKKEQVGYILDKDFNGYSRYYNRSAWRYLENDDTSRNMYNMLIWFDCNSSNQSMHLWKVGTNAIPSVFNLITNDYVRNISNGYTIRKDGISSGYTEYKIKGLNGGLDNIIIEIIYKSSWAGSGKYIVLAKRQTDDFYHPYYTFDKFFEDYIYPETVPGKQHKRDGK